MHYGCSPAFLGDNTLLYNNERITCYFTVRGICHSERSEESVNKA